jgi:vitamin B12 transporter
VSFVRGRVNHQNRILLISREMTILRPVTLTVQWSRNLSLIHAMIRRSGTNGNLKMKNNIVRLTAIMLSMPGTILAQTGPAEDGLDTVIVYGVRMEQPLTEAGTSVSIISAEEIEAMGINFALDALALAPGVTINQNGAFGGAGGVRIRGALSEQTLVIIDGVVANDPSSPGGGFNFARFDTASIDRIEVLKGPQSTLWGTDAIGGVVNIVTKRPEQGFGGKVFAEGGSFSSVRGGAEVNGANEAYDFLLAANGNSTDGISKADEKNGNTEKDGYESTTLNGRGGLNLPGEARIEASFLWTDAEAEFDSFNSEAEGNVGDGVELNKTTELVSNISLKLPLFDGRLENVLLLGYSDIDRENFTAGEPGFSSEGDRTTLRYQGTLAINDRNRLAFGAEREDSAANEDETSIEGLFALYELKPLDSLTLSAGLRRDDHERYGAETTGRFSLAYNPNDQVTVSGSWGEGFKAPTIFQTTFFCCGAVGPNTNLEAERSEAYDIGITLRTSDRRGELGVTYFDQDTTNQIDFFFDVGGYGNISEAKSSGFEIEGSFQFSDWAGLAVSYAYIDAVDGEGERLSRVPENSGNVTLRLDPEGPISGSVLALHNGGEKDQNNVVDSWTRVDVSGRYALNEKVEIYVHIENLLDEEYQQILGYGTPGLSGRIGATLRF